MASGTRRLAETEPTSPKNQPMCRLLDGLA